MHAQSVTTKQSRPQPSQLDYKIWSVVQQRVYQSWVHNTDELKHAFGARLAQHEPNQTIIDSAAIDDWRGRLYALCGQRVDTLNKCCDIY